MVRRVAAVLALGLAILVAVLLGGSPNITYGDFEIECNSIIGSAYPPGSVRGYYGGPVGFSVERGEEAIEALEREAGQNGIRDPYYITANLERDCTDRRIWGASWVAISAAAAALCLAITILDPRRTAR